MNKLNERQIRKKIREILDVQLSTSAVYGNHSVAVTNMEISIHQRRKMEDKLYELIQEVLNESKELV